MDTIETLRILWRKVSHHFLQMETYQLMQRRTEIRKCWIAADLGLQIYRKALREEPVAVREEDMSQLMCNGGLARDDPPGRKLHVPGAAEPSRHQGFRDLIISGYGYLQNGRNISAPARLNRPTLYACKFPVKIRLEYVLLSR